MPPVVYAIVSAIGALFRSQLSLLAENIALRHQRGTLMERLERKATTMCIMIMRLLTTCAAAAAATLFAGTVAAQAITVTCESIEYRNQVCPVPRGPVALVRQLSTPPGDCIKGRTWGFDGRNNTIWVSKGCRAEFHVGYR